VTNVNLIYICKKPTVTKPTNCRICNQGTLKNLKTKSNRGHRSDLVANRTKLMTSCLQSVRLSIINKVKIYIDIYIIRAYY